MYFRNYRLRKMWLVKCLKRLVWEHRATVKMLTNLKNCNRELPSYCFITFAKIELINVALSVLEILGVFVSPLTADDKYSLGNRKNLRKPIELQLPKKQKSFFSFLLHIWNLHKMLKYFKKKKWRSQYRDWEICG